MNLFPIAWRSTLFVSCVGVIYMFYRMLVRQPFEPLDPPYCMVYFAMLAFWAIVWCITPKRWWKP